MKLLGITPSAAQTVVLLHAIPVRRSCVVSRRLLYRSRALVEQTEIACLLYDGIVQDEVEPELGL